jgi:ATP-dependent Zn protease
LRPAITTLPIPNFASVSASIFFNNSSCSRHAQTPKDLNKEKHHKENLLRSTKNLTKKIFLNKTHQIASSLFCNKQTNKQTTTILFFFLPSFFLSFFLFLSFLPSFFRCALSLQLGGTTKHKSISPQQQQQRQQQQQKEKTTCREILFHNTVELSEQIRSQIW